MRLVEFVLVFRSCTMFCIVLTMFGVCDMAKQTLAIWIMMKWRLFFHCRKNAIISRSFRIQWFRSVWFASWYFDVTMPRSNFIWLLVFCLSRVLSHIPSLDGREKVAIHTHWLTDDDDNKHIAKLCGHQITTRKENRSVFDWITPFDLMGLKWIESSRSNRIELIS